MKKKLFLTGPDRSGKSKLIHRALGDDIRRAGGFITAREWDGDGNALSFDLMPADGSGQAERFLEFVDGRAVSHPEVFSQSGTRMLRQAGNRNFVVLDELGGVELLDDSFVRALVQLLRSDTPCIGVLRGPGTAKTVGVMGLNLRYELARRVLQEHLMKDPNVLVVETTGADDPEAMKLVDAWVAEYVREETEN